MGYQKAKASCSWYRWVHELELSFVEHVDYIVSFNFHSESVQGDRNRNAQLSPRLSHSSNYLCLNGGRY